MEKLKGLTAIVGTGATYIFGGWDNALVILVIMIVLDYLTGLLKAIVKKEVSSNIGFNGIARKAVIFIVLIVAVLLDRLIEFQWFFRTIACWFYIGNEGVSILENCVVIGAPIPQVVKDKLIQIKDKTNIGEIE